MRPQLAILLAAVLASACHVSTRSGPDSDEDATGPTKHETFETEVGKAEMVDATFEFGAGELLIEGGAPGLASAEFDYNVPSWKPKVTYDTTGFRGRLVFTQGSTDHLSGNNMKNNWHVRLGDKTPLDVTVKCGAGKAQLKLGELNLRSVKVNLGAGEVDLDLRGGEPRNDIDAVIRGGVGEARILVPESVGVIAEATGGLGEVEVKNMTKRDDSHWVNGMYGKSKSTIHLDVKGGIGRISIQSE